MKKINKTKKGFTIVELMLVIAIIGILSVILMLIIDPASMRRRAKDATIKASLTKVASNVWAYTVSAGKIPNEYEFLLDTPAITEAGVSCDLATDAECLFKVNGIDLPDSCDSTGWKASGAFNNSDCSFFYCGGDDGADTNAPQVCERESMDFKLMVKGYNGNNVLMFRSKDSVTYICNSSGNDCSQNTPPTPSETPTPTPTPTLTPIPTPTETPTPTPTSTPTPSPTFSPTPTPTPTPSPTINKCISRGSVTCSVACTKAGFIGCSREYSGAGCTGTNVACTKTTGAYCLCL